jgi:hypothetical protein
MHPLFLLPLTHHIFLSCSCSHFFSSEFLFNESPTLFWHFVEQLGVIPEGSEEQQYKFALEKVAPLISEDQSNLLAFSLSTRYFSPSVQVHRQLLDTLLQSLPQEKREQLSQCKAFAYSQGAFACSPSELPSLLEYVFLFFFSPSSLAINFSSTVHTERKPLIHCQLNWSTNTC